MWHGMRKRIRYFILIFPISFSIKTENVRQQPDVTFTPAISQKIE
jgi:hypothetical protein